MAALEPALLPAHGQTDQRVAALQLPAAVWPLEHLDNLTVEGARIVDVGGLVIGLLPQGRLAYGVGAQMLHPAYELSISLGRHRCCLEFWLTTYTTTVARGRLEPEA
uniref:Uncharacterized protein n=1 Tax=Alexandrium monilatum TaxID=311494 RepID=A0A7S4W530_9DINO